MIAQYIATRTIMDLCEELVRRLGKRVSKQQWQHEVLDLVGAQTVEEVDMVGETEGTEREMRREQQRIKTGVLSIN